MMSFIGDKPSASILWLPCEGRKLGVGGRVWGRHERCMEQRRARCGHGVSSVIGSRWRVASSGVAVHPPESRGSARVLGLTE
jgi:hypothetical protein